MESKNYNNNLTMTDAQKDAIEYGSGPLMVLAGPGSGKTFVITHRVRYLIEKLDVNPSNILVVTFSNMAAHEMEERYNSFGLKRSGRVTFGTFHSVYFSILKTAYGYRGSQVASEEERMKIMLQLIVKYNIEGQDIKSLAYNILSEVALVKEEKINLDNFYSGNCPADIFRKIYSGYESKLGELKKIDFEDMLLMTYDLFKERKDIREACSNRYKWILIDEFQDINKMQYETIQMMASNKVPNLTIVGDDDQSIYRFRGAKPQIMLGFKKDYPATKKILLGINFRSSEQIVKLAVKLIANNKERFIKELYSARGVGKQVVFADYDSTLEEVKEISKEIRNYIASGYSYDDVAVLYRTNLQPRMLTQVLMEDNIPFIIRDIIPNIMDHWIARDICSYLKLARNIGNRSDLLRIVNRPLRYIKRDALNDPYADLDEIRNYYEDSQFMLDRIDKLDYDLRVISRMNVYEAIRYIRESIGYDDFIEEYSQEKGIEKNELIEVLDELVESSEGFLFPEEWFEHNERYRRDIIEQKKIQKYNKNQNQAEPSRIRLMTFHASKGLEFKIIYIIDANDGIIPHRKAKSVQDIEEERRMFYVAITRARDRLHICTCKNKYHRKAIQSPFVAECKKE